MVLGEGWGIIHSPVAAKGYGFIREIVRNGHLAVSGLIKLAFQERRSSGADGLQRGQFVRYDLRRGRYDEYEAENVKPLASLPGDIRQYAELGIRYPATVTAATFVTHSGDITLHATQVVAPTLPMTPSQPLYWLVSEPGSARVLVALPVTAPGWDALSDLMSLTPPDRYKGNDPWDSYLLAVLSTAVTPGEKERLTIEWAKRKMTGRTLPERSETQSHEEGPGRTTERRLRDTMAALREAFSRGAPHQAPPNTPTDAPLSPTPPGTEPPVSRPGSTPAGPTLRHGIKLHPEAEAIKRFATERNLQRILHLTPIANLPGIIEAGAILSRGDLDLWDSARRYARFDYRRLDGRAGHVNCSLSYYNMQMFFRLVHVDKTPVALCVIAPDYLWAMGTLFSPVNAATNSGARVTSGFAGLASLFEEKVRDKKGVQTRNGKPLNVPTCIQAEVLIDGRIPLDGIVEILVRNASAQQAVKQAGWKKRVRVASGDFDYKNEWYNRSGHDHDEATVDDFDLLREFGLA